MKMKKILKVARREFTEAVKNKTFVISFIITAILFGAILFLMSKSDKILRSKKESMKIAVIDLSGKLNDDIKKVFDDFNARNTASEIFVDIKKNIPVDIEPFIEKQKQDVRDKNIKAFALISADEIAGTGTSKYFVMANNISDIENYEKIKNLLNESVLNYRIKENNLTQDIVNRIFKRINLEEVNLGAKSEKKGFSPTVVMIPFFFMYLMFMGIVGVSQQMLTTVIEEKNSRVYEVLLSSVSPVELMAGKIIGLSGVGFLTLSIWITIGTIFGIYSDYTHLINAKVIILFFLYFIPGFLLTASMIAAIGSTCNTTREAQNYMTPVMLILIVPMMAWFYIAQNPNSTFAVILSFIPPITPMVMILRLSVNPDVPMPQIIVSLFLLVASVPVAMKIAGKVFRTGILMYGKQPSPREILRWLKYR